MAKKEINWDEFKTNEFAKWAEENLMPVVINNDKMSMALFMNCFNVGIATGLDIAKELIKK